MSIVASATFTVISPNLLRYSNRVKLGVDDTERANRALLGVKGKRLTYQTARN